MFSSKKQNNKVKVKVMEMNMSIYMQLYSTYARFDLLKSPEVTLCD